MEGVVSAEQAEKEINEFLDFMEITTESRQLPEMKAIIGGLIKNIENGRLTIDENKMIIQKLIHPLGDVTTELKYDHRFETGTYYKALKNLNKEDQTGRAIAKLSVLSKQPIGVIEKLRREDYNVATLIAVFF